MSSSVRPPHTPQSCLVSSAHLRHSDLTLQPKQNVLARCCSSAAAEKKNGLIAFASSVFSAQRARECQPISSKLKMFTTYSSIKVTGTTHSTRSPSDVSPLSLHIMYSRLVSSSPAYVCVHVPASTALNASPRLATIPSRWIADARALRTTSFSMSTCSIVKKTTASLSSFLCSSPVHSSHRDSPFRTFFTLQLYLAQELGVAF